MKKLLLLCLALAGTSSTFAQANCATATEITADGTFTTGPINGTYLSPCLGGTTNDAGTAMKARWWKYTPTINGEITVTSALAVNPVATTDTRVSILKGTCGAQTCVDSDDDVSATDYRSTLTVPVAAGTTYYIEWDNYWSATTFTFQFTFVATSCVRPGQADFYLPDTYTTTSASLYWNNAIGGPANYDIDWSTTYTAAAGTGTIVSVPAGATTFTQGDISGLPASSNFRYFVRSDCGGSQSAWAGPFYGYLAVPLPYTNDFEDSSKNYTDGFIGFSRITTSPTSNPPSYADGGDGVSMYTFNSTTVASNIRGYFRGVNLVFGEEVTVTFKTRLFTPSTTEPASPMNFDLTVGASQSAIGQTTVVDSFINDSDAEYTTHTATYTAAEDGIHYFGIHNNSDPGAVQTFLFLDTIELTTNLSNNEVVANSFNVSPNPASSLVTISNTTDALINSASIVDMNGRVVKNLKVANLTETQINVSDLAKGVYMINVSSDKGNVTKKLVIK
ncbi:MAG: T9SS type A sorting domain-containing protein [Flavobacterium sp. JAD_PAG50586_2]|nr:MAG: T9SS type A sorting domain-containing protein [Flavobacterium sp. JAD_PAG50586_2]